MKRIYIPTNSSDDWKSLLAKPDLHWKSGYSAKTLALSWESAHPGMPGEVLDALSASQHYLLERPTLLLAIPEYQVDLPGGRRPSQTDLFALIRGSNGLVALAVEGKVDEPFGPTVGEKRAEQSHGVDVRLRYLTDLLGLETVPDTVRYQLLHRTASAILIAKQFDAAAAVMLVHSFSPTGLWFSDFAAFAALLGIEAAPGQAFFAGEYDGIPLFLGWCVGEQRFRESA